MAPKYDVGRILEAHADLLRSGMSPAGIGLAVWEQRGGKVTYRRPGHHTFSLYLRGGNFVRRSLDGCRRSNSTGSPGAICIIPKGSELSWENRGYVRWLHIYFRTHHLEAATNGEVSTPVSMIFGCDPTLRELAQRFILVLDWNERENGGALDHALLALLARSLAIEHTTSDFRAPNGGLTGAQRRAVEEMVAVSLSDRITVQDLAEVSGLSTRQFSRAFTVSYGASPYEWVLRQRVETAHELLADGQSAHDVAASCGFSSQSHMIRRFRSVFGYTPNAVR